MDLAAGYQLAEAKARFSDPNWYFSSTFSRSKNYSIFLDQFLLLLHWANHRSNAENPIQKWQLRRLFLTQLQKLICQIDLKKKTYPNVQVTFL